MFGPMYSQMMKARLGVGKPMEGYGGFGQPRGMEQGGVAPPPTPWGPQGGASLPAPSPWLHQKDNMGGATLPPPTPWEPSGGATLPQESPMKPSVRGYMGGMKNPWQRY